MAKLVLGTTKSVVVPAIVKEVAPVEPYPLLSRVKDDSNNNVGFVTGYFTDANNQKYAVVCLKRQEPFASNYYSFLSVNVEVTGLEMLNNYFAVWESKSTATDNCDKILDFADDNGYTSSAVTACRTKSFVIGGVTYSAQLPNLIELMDIIKHKTELNALDNNLVGNATFLTSNQFKAPNRWELQNEGLVQYNGKTSQQKILPVLEIPIN